MVEKMSQPMVGAAMNAGISIKRAEEIYSLKVLGREFYQGDYVDLSLTYTESAWIVDVFEMLSEKGGTWNPKNYHRFEKKKTAKRMVINAIFTLIGEDETICGASPDQLESLITHLNGARVDISDDPKLSMDDIDDMVTSLINYGVVRYSELLDEYQLGNEVVGI